MQNKLKSPPETHLRILENYPQRKEKSIFEAGFKNTQLSHHQMEEKGTNLKIQKNKGLYRLNIEELKDLRNQLVSKRN
jgi:hypothetical protein